MLSAALLAVSFHACWALNPEYDTSKAPGSAADAVDATFYGKLTGDYLGRCMSMADLNGDGRDDLILASGLANGGSPARNDSGAVHVWFGSAAFSGIQDAAGTSGTAPDVTIIGVANSQTTNFKGLEVGDVNGDGVQDLILVSHYVANSLSGFGSVYVIYGRQTPTVFPALIDLDTSTAEAHADVRIEISSIHNSQGGLAVGDVNGDGADDILVGSSFKAADNPVNSGEICVILGRISPAALPASMTRASADFYVYGASNGLYVSQSGVLMTGDVNDDGLDDILMTSRSDLDALPRLYVLFGRTTFATKYSLQDPIYGHGRPTADVVIKAIAAGDLIGLMNAAAVADVNGDGVKDIILGAPEGDGPSDARLNAGEVYVVFGRKLPDTFPSSLDLAVAGNSGANVTIYGYATQGKLASTGSGISAGTRGALTTGDVNGDGHADILLGAPYAQSSAGEVYVVYGRASGVSFPATLDLGTTDTAAFFSIVGADNFTPGRLSDYGSILAADINGDGADDLVLGAGETTSGPTAARTRAGEAYIVYGRESPATFPASLNMATVGTGGADVTLYGAANEDGLASYTALAAGDLNGDGGMDVAIGAPSANGPSGAPVRGDGGQTYLIKGPLPPLPEIEVELVGSPANTPLTDGVDTAAFGSVAPGGMTTQTFLVRNAGQADLTNVDVSFDEGDPDHVEFWVSDSPDSIIAPGQSTTFEVTYEPSADGSHSVELRVASNDGDEDPFRVNVTGRAVLAPEISVRDEGAIIETEAPVDLGNVIMGGFVEHTFSVENTGTEALTNIVVTIPNTAAAAAFSPVSLPASSLAPNASSSFTIRFRPALLGAHAVTIAVGSNDADENPFNIRLRGMCIAPGAVVGTPASEAAAPADTIGAWATSLAGSYTGLIKDGSNTVIGRVADLKALPVIPRIRPNPTLEGNILFKGRTVAIKVVISPSGAVAATIPTSKAISTGDMQLALQFFKTNVTESPVLRGTVTWLGITATLDATTSPGTGTLQLLNPAWPGRYTLALPAEDGWGNSQPGGDGFASVTIASSGAVVITGYLGDGTLFSTKSVLNPDGRMPIYQDIVRAGVSRGSIAGTLTMRDVPGVSDFDGRLQWTRIKDDGAANYRNGFSVQVWCLGSRYTAPAINVRMLSQLPTHDHNARLLVVSPFSASTPESYSLDWTAKNALKHYGPYFISSSVATPLGQLKVLSRPLSTAIIQRTMNMVCLQKQGIAVGYYSTGTLTGRCRIDPGDYPHPGSEYTGAIQRPGQPAVPAVAPAITAVSNPTTFAGTYNGVVIDDLSRMAGGLEGIVIGSNGSFTATLWLRGVRHGFTGRLFPDGTVSVSIPRTGLPSMALNLQLYLEDGSTNGYELNGTLEASGSQYTIQSQRLPNYTTVLRSPNEGPYTLAFLSPTGVNVATEPGGDGYGNLSVSYLGVCSGICKLADASTFTFASHVSRSGEWSLHRGLYNGKAWVAGKLTFRDTPNISDLDGEWRWEKQSGAVPASFPYSGGFAVTRPVVGCRYLAPVKGYPAFTQLPASYLNAWVRLSGPDFSTLPAVTLTARDRAMSWLVDDTLISHGPDTMKALLTRSTGVFSGTYTDAPFGVNQAIGGVLLQKQGVVTGHYLHGPASGLVVIMPKP